MAKRYIDTELFKQGWFRKLSPTLKSAWIYLITNCDHAGIYEPDLELMSFCVGSKITKDDIIKRLGDQISELNGGGKWFLHKFIGYQYGELSETNNVHKSVIKILSRYDINLDPWQGLGRVSQEPKDKDKDKEVDKNKDILELVDVFFNFQRNIYPNRYRKFDEQKESYYNGSYNTIDRLIRIDEYNLNEIKATLSWAVKDSFWGPNILSLSGLRDKSKNGRTKFENIYNKYEDTDKTKSVEDFING